MDNIKEAAHCDAPKEKEARDSIVALWISQLDCSGRKHKQAIMSILQEWRKDTSLPA